MAKANIIQRRSKAKSAPKSEAYNLDEGNRFKFEICAHIFNFILCLLDIDNSDDIEKTIAAVKSSIVIDERCICLWEKTFSYRVEQLNSEISTFEYIKQYPVIEQIEGYKLVS